MSTDPQYFLDKIAASDEFGFLQADESNWGTHRPLLYLACMLTSAQIIELGSGDSSTSYLRQLATKQDRIFLSFDSNPEWAAKTNSKYIENWDANDEWKQNCSVLLVDEAPGEHRRVAIMQMKERADIIIIHDTELNSAADYKVEPLWKEFRYVLHYNRTGGGAGATAVSQTVDLNRFKFLSLSQYKFE